MTLYPTDELRIAEFSSRGPFSDGRRGPDLAAIGVYNLSPFSSNSVVDIGLFFRHVAIGPAGGGRRGPAPCLGPSRTDPSISARHIRNALIEGAVPLDESWDVQAQGAGLLNIRKLPGAARRRPGRRGSSPRQRRRQAQAQRPARSPGIGHRTCELGTWPHAELGVSSRREASEEVSHRDRAGGAERFRRVLGGIRLPRRPSFSTSKVPSEAASTLNSSAEPGSLATRRWRSAPGSVVFAGARSPATWLSRRPRSSSRGLMKLTLGSAGTNNTAALNADVTITRIEGPRARDPPAAPR